MPIKITDFEWKQIDSLVFIKFGLHNTSPKNVDIIYTTSYIKVNFRPYLFELFLKHKIEPEKSSVSVRDGKVNCILSKSIIEKWDLLEEEPKSREEAQSLRVKALEEYETLQIEKNKEKKENKSSLERLAISRQISLDEEKHLREKEFLKLEELKFFEERKQDLDSSSKESRLRLSSMCSEDGSTIASEGDYDGDEESANFSSNENLFALTKNKLSDKESESIIYSEKYPNIRPSSCIKIRLSPHTPSIPKRESVSSLDEEIIEKKKGCSEEKLVDDDKESLKSRASKFFESGNYEESIKIYTQLLDRCPSQASYYSNRAASYLALNSYKKAITDCSKALELMIPASKENAKSRLLCHVRRGTSYVRLRDLSSALIDYESAFHLDPTSEALEKDVAAIKDCLTFCPGTCTEEESSEFHSSSSSSSEEEESECSSENEGREISADPFD
ncbi:Dyslexia susceptibility 1 candidate 1-like protein [Armadillidium nasatum]|uniref:Dyslexia susceptibility 1 candidate 1-like protein n=1 Tax=Armadillidium nasatum TaxID=96803 RepID=A0A5N5SJY4_9CRUS|nr:Dyslexia susceptibility 1 candidate 1-like protein [Armadillidium nasatum]